MTCAPRSSATAAVRSREPSSTTTISSPGSNARISSITRAIASCSFSAGTIAILFSAVRRGSSARAASATSATDRLRDAHAEQLEQPAGAVEVGVLVEGPLPGGPAHLLRPPGVVEQLLVRGGRLVGGADDEQLPARLEPAL